MKSLSPAMVKMLSELPREVAPTNRTAKALVSRDAAFWDGPMLWPVAPERPKGRVKGNRHRRMIRNRGKR